MSIHKYFQIDTKITTNRTYMYHMLKLGFYKFRSTLNDFIEEITLLKKGQALSEFE